MKGILLCILFVLFLAGADAQEQRQINANKLVEIIEKADFTILVKLVSSLNYLVLDSSRNTDGSLFYYAKEIKINGNVLACSANAKTKITELTFNTFTREVYLDLKYQIKKSGFKSQGTHKDNTTDILESEDFEKGKLLVATAVRKNDDGILFYEFTFLKW